MSAVERLATNLAAQSGAATELEGLLERERHALDHREWSQIIAVAEAKAAATRRMQHLVAELHSLAGARKPADAIAAAGLSDPWNTLLAQAARLQRANRELRTRLDRQQHRIAAALKLLSRAGDGAPLYGRDGRTGFNPTANRLARA
ncbi:MAG TPA: flagellar export chaperone FlgN [Nevskiaceae bacterium]|nr:flagellar export chaperone FlgN [Nevskiaceae bacterium]